MTGFSGRISAEGDAEGAASVMVDAMKFADTLSAWKQTQGVDNVIRAFDLGGGYYCVAVDLKNMRALHIVSPPDYYYDSYSEEMPQEEVETTGVIDVVSGRVNSPTIVKQKVQVTQPNGDVEEVEYDVLNSFTSTTRTAGRYTDLFRRRRLAVPENSIFAKVGANPEIVFSEHANVRPTCYSGAMRRAAQLVLGIGKVLRPTYEEKWMEEKKKSALVLSDDSIRSAFTLYEKKDPGVQVQLAWDYRFAKTHGITFDQSNKPWLVEISTRGVHAMPLYMDPVSQTADGKQRYKDVGPELTDFLDEFGGVPLGVTMPVLDTFTKYKNAGEVVQLLSSAQMSVFYGKSAFSSEIGWCFNERGTEAHNTCYSYDAAGVIDSYHYNVNIALVGETLPEFTDKTARAAALFGNAQYKIRKCRRMTDAQAQLLIDLYEDDAEEAVKEFDALAVAPTLQGSANIVQIEKGQLFHPAKPLGQPQIKFPEPIIGGLVSFDFTPAGGWNSVPNPPSNCEGPMFVTFTDGGIDVIRYSYDARPQGPSQPYENTREECQYVGSWTEKSAVPAPYLMGNFYSNKIDWRTELIPSQTTAVWTSKQATSYNYAAAEFFFATCIDVTRQYVFRLIKKWKTTSGNFLRIAVAIPEGDRCAYYITRHYGATAVSEGESSYYEEVTGPYMHYYQIYNFVFHWFGRCYMPPSNRPPSGGLACVAKLMAEVLIPSCLDPGNYDPPDEMLYAVCPSNWSSNPNTAPLTVMSSWQPPAIIGSAAWGGSPLPPRYDTYKRTNEPEQGCDVKLVNGSGHGQVEVKKEFMKGIDPLTGDPVDYYSLGLSSWWWRMAPDPDDGSCPQLSVTHSCLGTNVMNYMDDLDGLETKYIGGPINMRGGTKSCYTGVIE